ncbi:MAG: ACT domain-containing protein [Oscillospiraceae bacterium]|nr:ACT domain-containing protein [Oscillospiraceae bacterium]
MRAIVTVAGKDHVGIIAGICIALSENGVNVLDINQTVMQEFLTMNMLVDTSTSTVSFADISAALEKAGRELAVSVRIQREDIFEAMHRI